MTEYFDRRQLLVIIGILFIALHYVDELVRGEGIAPPLIPMVLLAAVYGFLPVILRAVTVIAFGVVIFIAQVFGHLTPLLDRAPSGSDYTGVFPMIGGVILIGVGVGLLRDRSRDRELPKPDPTHSSQRR